VKDRGYYFHAPRYPSRWGVLDVGLKCTHSCKFCHYLYLDGTDDPVAGMRHAKFHPREHVLAVVDSLAENGFAGFDVTGGEPCLHPDIVEITRHAVERGIAIRIITLGQWLMQPMEGTDGKDLIDALLDAGVTNFHFSCHAVSERLFYDITGESWTKLRSAMNHLDAKGFHYTTNTTVFQDNYRALPDIARELAKHDTYLHDFVVMDACYEWAKEGRAVPVQAKYSDVAPYLREAVRILEDAGIAANVRYAPQCTIAGLEKNHVGIVSVRYDPYEWMNAVDHSGNVEGVRSPRDQGERISIAAGQPSPGAAIFRVKGQVKDISLIAGRGSIENIVRAMPASSCGQCSAIEVCDGVDPRYLAAHGVGELVPYVDDNRGSVLDKDRLAYRAAFFVKLKPRADVRSQVRKALKPVPIPLDPKVSVIVTCYNYGNYLKECVLSIMDQSWRGGMQVIVVDDGSTDDTPDVCSRLTDQFGRIEYYRTENSGQPAHSRNHGISKAVGDLILCVDADDRLASTMIEECVDHFRKHPEASIVYTGVQCFGESNDLLKTHEYDYGVLIQRNLIYYCSMYRREVWDAVGGYRTNVRGSEDWQFWIEAGGLGYIGVPLPRQLWFYRVHSEGIFLTHVQPNLEAKFRQIVLNNPCLYSPQQVDMAKQGLDVPRIIA
jgi:molybdenum cofactor biosynthesis enzyme MoaA